MKSCTSCGKENEDTVVTCIECGTDLQTPESDSLPDYYILRRAMKVLARMTTNQKRLIVGLAALLVGIVIYIASGYLHRPRMSEAEVIRVANGAAVAEGFRLSEYFAPRARFEFGHRDRTWRVMYDLKMPTPWEPSIPAPQSAHGAPRHFFVIVEDTTARTHVGMLVAVGTPQTMAPPSGVTILKYYTNQGFDASRAK